MVSAVFMDFILGDSINFFPHPVILIGRLINYLRNKFFIDVHSFFRGFLVCIFTLIISGTIVFLILYLTNSNLFIKIYMIYSALAWRDLKDETEKVFLCLIKHDLVNARKYLSYVVGRDTENLNECEISCAVIETIAENSIDGIISVIFFALIGQIINQDYGMCICVWIFKASSTLDSMIGYESLGNFGMMSAKLDDAMNFIPARLGGLTIILAGLLMGRNGMKVFLRDRLKHKSPNSAHGESAFAGVMGVKLGGGSFYGGRFESREYINVDGRMPEITDIIFAWKLLDISCSLFLILVICIVRSEIL